MCARVPLFTVWEHGVQAAVVRCDGRLASARFCRTTGIGPAVLERLTPRCAKGAHLAGERVCRVRRRRRRARRG